jgi:hypothetical protein
MVESIDQDICPECGSKLTWVCGVAECDCGYSEILSPCVCCCNPTVFLYDASDCKSKCKAYLRWKTQKGLK